MNFACPRCSRTIDLRRGACPGCGLNLTLGDVLGYYWGDFKLRCQRVAFVKCACGRRVRINAAKCACGKELTVGMAIDETVVALIDPRREQIQTFLDGAKEKDHRRIQWCYFLFSVALVWWMTGYVSDHLGGAMVRTLALTVVFLSGFALVFSVLVPRKFVRRFWKATPALVKLSILANYLSLLLLLQVLSVSVR